MTVLQFSPAKAEAKVTKVPTKCGGGRISGSRAVKLNALQQKLERLQGDIKSLMDELKDRAIDDAGVGKLDPVCNSCYTRKKGAALYPCGHTFCWKCTSKLRRGGAPCPFCKKQFWTALGITAAVNAASP